MEFELLVSFELCRFKTLHVLQFISKSEKLGK